jgi:Tol biopolymer transport system component
MVRAEIRQKPTSGAGQEETLTLLQQGYPIRINAWSKDGKFIAYTHFDYRTAHGIWLVPVQGDRKPFAYVDTEFAETHAQFSPDGRRMAYTSDESGELRVYVQAIPAGRDKWQVSTSGGDQPMWRADGRELFYVASDHRLMAVPVKPGQTFEAGTAQVLFGDVRMQTSGMHQTYQPSGDGQRFLVTEPTGEDEAPGITVTLNWPATLKQ